jgi:hypothetical protein
MQDALKRFPLPAKRRLIRRYTLVAMLLLGSVAANARTLQVHCGTHSGLTSIGAALNELKQSSDGGPATIVVTGGCVENVVIKDLDRLTIAGEPGASISDASNGTRDVVVVNESSVTLSGLAINGNANTDGVDCYNGSRCTLIGGTVQGAYDGVGIYKTAVGSLTGTVLQNNAYSGLRVVGDAGGHGITIRGNPFGVAVIDGGRALLVEGDPVFYPLPTDTPLLVVSNGTGVLVGEGAAFQCGGCTIQNNSSDGVHADVSAAISIGPSFNYDGLTYQSTITQNSGVGVYVGDLASAVFLGGTSVSGNAQPDIACNSPTAVTRGALAAAGGNAHTNCPN